MSIRKPIDIYLRKLRIFKSIVFAEIEKKEKLITVISIIIAIGFSIAYWYQTQLMKNEMIIQTKNANKVYLEMLKQSKISQQNIIVSYMPIINIEVKQIKTNITNKYDYDIIINNIGKGPAIQVSIENNKYKNIYNKRKNIVDSNNIKLISILEDGGQKQIFNYRAIFHSDTDRINYPGYIVFDVRFFDIFGNKYDCSFNWDGSEVKIEKYFTIEKIVKNDNDSLLDGDKSP